MFFLDLVDELSISVDIGIERFAVIVDWQQNFIHNMVHTVTTLWCLATLAACETMV